MLRRRPHVITLLAAVGLVLGIASATAAAAPPPLRPHAQQLPAAVQAWLAQQRHFLIAAGGRVVSASSAQPTPTPVFSYSMMAAGRLTASKTPDVLDLREIHGGADSLGITARNGDTGKPLWHLVDAEPSSDETSVFSLRLGSHDKPGVLLVDAYSIAAVSPGAPITVVLKLTALAGSGDQVWTRSIKGLFDSSDDTGTNQPLLTGILHDGSEHPPEILVERESGPASSRFTATAETVSLAGGHVHHVKGTTTSTTDFPSYLALPDVNGDGKGDVLVLRPGLEPLRAITAATGATIWRSKPVSSEQLFPGITVVSAGGHPMLAVVDQDTFDAPWPTTLVDGRDGKVYWTKTIASVFAVGRSGEHLEPAVGVTTTTTAPTTTQIISTLVLRSVSMKGHVIWKRVVTAVVPGMLDSSYGYNDTVTPVGEALHDGATDSVAEANVDNFTQQQTTEGLVNGRTGALRTGAYQIGTAGSLGDGSGPDLASVFLATGTGQASIEAWRGSTGKRYYNDELAGLDGIGEITIVGARVSGHPCSDILLTAENTGETVVTQEVLSGGGSVLWSVAADATAAAGGTRTKGSKPAHTCA